MTRKPKPARKPLAWPAKVSGGVQAIISAVIQPNPKEQPLRDEAYRRLVAALPCYFCGIEGFSQCCHSDEGKGMGIKSSDQTCFALCTARRGYIGCHALVGASGIYKKEARREFERKAAAWTREQLGKT